MEKLVISDELKGKLDNYCRLLEQEMVKKYPTTETLHYKYTYKVMNKFIKVIQCDYRGNEVSVWCFVDTDGNLYKADGWKRPAPHIRGHIDKPIIDGYGFYLKF